MIHNDKERRKIRFNDLSEDLRDMVSNFIPNNKSIDKLKAIVDKIYNQYLKEKEMIKIHIHISKTQNQIITINLKGKTITNKDGEVDLFLNVSKRSKGIYYEASITSVDKKWSPGKLNIEPQGYIKTNMNITATDAVLSSVTIKFRFEGLTEADKLCGKYGGFKDAYILYKDKKYEFGSDIKMNIDDEYSLHAYPEDFHLLSYKDASFCWSYGLHSLYGNMTLCAKDNRTITLHKTIFNVNISVRFFDQATIPDFPYHYPRLLLLCSNTTRSGQPSNNTNMRLIRYYGQFMSNSFISNYLDNGWSARFINQYYVYKDGNNDIDSTTESISTFEPNDKISMLLFGYKNDANNEYIPDGVKMYIVFSGFGNIDITESYNELFKMKNGNIIHGRKFDSDSIFNSSKSDDAIPNKNFYYELYDIAGSVDNSITLKELIYYVAKNNKEFQNMYSSLSDSERYVTDYIGDERCASVNIIIKPNSLKVKRYSFSLDTTPSHNIIVKTKKTSDDDWVVLCNESKCNLNIDMCYKIRLEINRSKLENNDYTLYLNDKNIYWEDNHDNIFYTEFEFPDNTDTINIVSKITKKKFKVTIPKTNNQKIYVRINNEKTYSDTFYAEYGDKYEITVVADEGYESGKLNGNSSGIITKELNIAVSDAMIRKNVDEFGHVYNTEYSYISPVNVYYTVYNDRSKYIAFMMNEIVSDVKTLYNNINSTGITIHDPDIDNAVSNRRTYLFTDSIKDDMIRYINNDIDTIRDRFYNNNYFKVLNNYNIIYNVYKYDNNHKSIIEISKKLLSYTPDFVEVCICIYDATGNPYFCKSKGIYNHYDYTNYDGIDHIILDETVTAPYILYRYIPDEENDTSMKIIIENLIEYTTSSMNGSIHIYIRPVHMQVKGNGLPDDYILKHIKIKQSDHQTIHVKIKELNNHDYTSDFFTLFDNHYEAYIVADEGYIPGKLNIVEKGHINAITSSHNSVTIYASEAKRNNANVKYRRVNIDKYIKLTKTNIKIFITGLSELDKKRYDDEFKIGDLITVTPENYKNIKLPMDGEFHVICTMDPSFVNYVGYNVKMGMTSDWSFVLGLSTKLLNKDKGYYFDNGSIKLEGFDDESLKLSFAAQPMYTNEISYYYYLCNIKCIGVPDGAISVEMIVNSMSNKDRIYPDAELGKVFEPGYSRKLLLSQSNMLPLESDISFKIKVDKEIDDIEEYIVTPHCNGDSNKINRVYKSEMHMPKKINSEKDFGYTSGVSSSDNSLEIRIEAKFKPVTVTIPSMPHQKIIVEVDNKKYTETFSAARYHSYKIDIVADDGYDPGKLNNIPYSGVLNSDMNISVTDAVKNDTYGTIVPGEHGDIGQLCIRFKMLTKYINDKYNILDDDDNILRYLPSSKGIMDIFIDRINVFYKNNKRKSYSLAGYSDSEILSWNNDEILLELDIEDDDDIDYIAICSSISSADPFNGVIKAVAIDNGNDNIIYDLQQSDPPSSKSKILYIINKLPVAEQYWKLENSIYINNDKISKYINGITFYVF